MRIIDLSKDIYSGMPVYPGDPEVSIEQVSTVGADGWQVSQLKLGTHTGTHVDAFSHMHPELASIDAIALEQFIGPAQLVRVHDGDFPKGLGLVFDETVDESVLESVIVANPPFVAGDVSEDLERALLGRGIVTFTDLINLAQLPRGETFLFIGLPLKIRQADGSPVRAVAVLDYS